MGNLRILQTLVVDSRTINVTFSADLDPLIQPSNVNIFSLEDGIPDALVTALFVNQNVLTVNCRPLTPFTPYFIEFFSTPTQPFRSANGTQFILEDNATNRVRIVGAPDPENFVQENLEQLLRENVYSLSPQSVAINILNSISTNIREALNDIGQAKNDNYLSITITDELKVRSPGPFDRLNEEGAFLILRVGLNETNSTGVPASLNFPSFPSDPITLQRQDINNESLTPGTGPGTFDNFILTVTKNPVTILTFVQIRYQNGNVYTYDIQEFGYQINDATFDSQNASRLVTLADNQFKLSEELLNDSAFVLPGAGDTIIVSYQFKNLGRVIDPETVEVIQVLDAVREVAPPLITDFNTQFAPIVNENNVIAGFGGIEFLDPESNPPFSGPPPAFTKEIPFRFNALPANPGEYAVDYESGRIIVFGATTEDPNGTGNFPPVMNYKYRKSFVSRLDFTYEEDSSLLVASPIRDLVGQNANITFEFEQTLIPGIDYREQIHEEVLDERIQNRLATTGSLKTLNTPITNVFRIFNETTGEIYGIRRFNDTTVFFNANIPPRIFSVSEERASFTNVNDETLISDQEFININTVRVFRIPLLNQNIIANTEDAIGSSFNTSATFSRTDIFARELYFDSQTLTITQNTDRLTIGDYMIDYRNGIIYVGVTTSQILNVGVINYKKPVIFPKNDHVTAVENIYNSINLANGVTKTFGLDTFGDVSIVPLNFDITDERFLNGDMTLPLIFNNGTILVSDDIKRVRGIFDAFDLNNNAFPLNFAPGSTFQNNIITVNPDGVQLVNNLFVGAGLVVSVPFVSPGMEIGSVSSVIRTTDNVQLADGYETFSGYDITLAASSGAAPGDPVTVIYNLVLNGGATPIVDYNRGELYVDYEYLFDEILVSYEYGDNVIDFRESDSISEGTEYFVTYRVGALRDALLQNFGSLVNIPILNSFDTSLPREIYRDALSGALQTFTKGPTIPAITQLVAAITKIDPQIIEALFELWTLGVSFLFPNPIEITGDPQLVPAKFDAGLLIDQPDQTVTFPVASNLQLEKGTLEFWVIPEWDGLDNDATLTFNNITRDGYAVSGNDIFIGSTNFNPTIENGQFSLNRLDNPSPVGVPPAIFTSTGVFIYYDPDDKRWNFLVKEPTMSVVNYSGFITTSGEFYDVKFIPDLGEISDVLRSDLSRVDFELNIDGYDQLSPDGYEPGPDGYVPGFSFDGITFLSDDEHYLFDFGKEETENRFSIFKDGRGYLNFRVYDRGDLRFPDRKNQYKVSADISSWRAAEQHHVAVAWRLNTSDRQDEMHLFIDGVEVPNIIKYGGRPIASSTDRFRTVKPEIIVGTVPKNIVNGNNLVTIAGNDVVTSTTNFTAAGILPGDSILIKEPGFTSYIINAVSGQSLTLSAPMPATLSDARFTINPFSVVTSSQIDLYKNIAVSILTPLGVETEIPGVRAEIPGYSILKNAFNQPVLRLEGDAQAGDQIVIRTLGLNFRRARTDVFVWGNTSNVLRTRLPPPINLDEVTVTKILLPLLPIGPNNSVLIAGNFVANGITTTQPTNPIDGRTLSVRVTGGNVDFTTPVSVTINGVSTGGPTETLLFTAPGTQSTVNRWLTITDVDVISRPIDPTLDSTAVEIREAFSITNPDGASTFAVIRFSYKTQTGFNLQGTGNNVVTDLDGGFFDSNVGQFLVINSPLAVAGTYSITSRVDTTSVAVSPNPPVPFMNGDYDVFNVTIGRSGFQNGFFFFEVAGGVNQPFALNEGFYEFDYQTYLEVPFDPFENEDIYIGSDFEGNNQADATIDELRISNVQLTDVRVGETLAPGEDSVTISANARVPFRKNVNTLALLHFDQIPLINDSDFFIISGQNQVESDLSVNSNFGRSLIIRDNPLTFTNTGLLSTASEGTIEFWVSPRFDTGNDPVLRFYFDANSATVENLDSTTSGTVIVNGRINEVIAVRLQTDTTNTGTNFFAGGSIASDRQTIRLGQALPFQQTPVKVIYTSSGVQENRISIFKDENSFIVFNVRTGGVDFQVRQPVFWPRDTWHRIRATYKFNRRDNRDEIRLFVDGEERNVLKFGTGLIFGTGFVFGQTTGGVSAAVLVADINFRDIINEIHFGGDFLGFNTAQARFDNIRLSNTSLNPFIVAGQPKDVNYNQNLNSVLPVVENAFTTLLLDFERLVQRNDQFALLRSINFGLNDFTLNIIDSFDIVLSNDKVRQVLEELIDRLKPAQARVNINYIQ